MLRTREENLRGRVFRSRPLVQGKPREKKEKRKKKGVEEEEEKVDAFLLFASLFALRQNRRDRTRRRKRPTTGGCSVETARTRWRGADKDDEEALRPPLLDWDASGTIFLPEDAAASLEEEAASREAASAGLAAVASRSIGKRRER